MFSALVITSSLLLHEKSSERCSKASHTYLTLPTRRIEAATLALVNLSYHLALLLPKNGFLHICLCGRSRTVGYSVVRI